MRLVGYGTKFLDLKLLSLIGKLLSNVAFDVPTVVLTIGQGDQALLFIHFVCI